MILVVCALRKEFVSKKHSVLYTGIGKLNASHFLTKFLSENKKIKTVINYGTAGGLKDNKNHLLECGSFYNVGFSNPLALDQQEFIITNPTLNSICSVNEFCTNTENLKKYNCVDMEAYALAYVCKKMNVFFRCYKYITDIVGEEEQYNNWEQNINKGTELFNKKLKNYE